LLEISHGTGVLAVFIGIYRRCHDTVVSTEQTAVAVWYKRE